jgi:hypothetical protein
VLWSNIKTASTQSHLSITKFGKYGMWHIVAAYLLISQMKFIVRLSDLLWRARRKTF